MNVNLDVLDNTYQPGPTHQTMGAPEEKQTDISLVNTRNTESVSSNRSSYFFVSSPEKSTTEAIVPLNIAEEKTNDLRLVLSHALP